MRPMSNPTIPCPYSVFVSEQLYQKIFTYLTSLRTRVLQPGKYLKEELTFAELQTITVDQFLDKLNKTRRPRLYADSDIFGGNGEADWNEQEISILSDISIAIDVKAYDDGRFDNPLVFDISNPLYHNHDVTLLFISGALLQVKTDYYYGIQGLGAAVDRRELMPEVTDHLQKFSDNTGLILGHGEGRIDPKDYGLNFEAYTSLYERRLLPVLMHANTRAREANTKAFITVPTVGGGQFAGEFEHNLDVWFFTALRRILEKHAGQLPYIRYIYYHPFLSRHPIPTTKDNVGHIEILVRPTDGSKLGPLCPAEQYNECGYDFKGLKVFSVVAGDGFSFLGNDIMVGIRKTDEGVKGAATTVSYRVVSYLCQQEFKASYITEHATESFKGNQLRPVRYDASGKLQDLDEHDQPLTWENIVWPKIVNGHGELVPDESRKRKFTTLGATYVYDANLGDFTPLSTYEAQKSVVAVSTAYSSAPPYYADRRQQTPGTVYPQTQPWSQTAEAYSPVSPYNANPWQHTHEAALPSAPPLPAYYVPHEAPAVPSPTYSSSNSGIFVPYTKTPIAITQADVTRVIEKAHASETGDGQEKRDFYLKNVKAKLGALGLPITNVSVRYVPRAWGAGIYILFLPKKEGRVLSFLKSGLQSHCKSAQAAYDILLRQGMPTEHFTKMDITDGQPGHLLEKANIGAVIKISAEATRALFTEDMQAQRTYTP